MFDIPTKWQWCSLSDLAIFGGGKTPSTARREYWDNGSYLWVTSKDMKCDCINDSILKLTDEGIKDMEIYPPLTILMVVRSGILRRTLPVAILGRPATVNQDIKAICLYNNLNPWYILFYFKALEKEILEDYQKDGTTVESIDFERLKAIPIAIPPYTEQKRIVESIEQWFFVINEIEQEKTDLNTSIKQTRSKILDLAIHGKLVPQDPNDEPAIELLRRINPDFKPCDNAHYIKLPQGWGHISLNGCMIEILNGFAFQSSKYVEKGVRVIRITNVQDGEIIDDDPKFYPELSIKELEKFILKGNDLLMSLTGNVGRVGFLPNELLPAALNQRVGCIRMNERFIHKKYLFYYFQTDTFKNDCIASAKGVAQLNISTEWLKQYMIHVPPLSEQKRIVTKIEELFATLDKIKESLEV